MTGIIVCTIICTHLNTLSVLAKIPTKKRSAFVCPFAFDAFDGGGALYARYYTACKASSSAAPLCVPGGIVCNRIKVSHL